MSQRLEEVIDGKYRLVKLLGRGGMGEVYQAEHTVINRTVAIKLLRARHATDHVMAERFIREAKAASAIGQENIVEIQDVGTTSDGSVYIVMELLDGESLRDLISRAGRLDAPRAVAITLEILSGLQAAHAAGIVHRDLKPDNVFLLANPAPDRQGVKLLDFGISKFTNPDQQEESELTGDGVALGTPIYMAPEQIRSAREADERTDLWAVGVMLHVMLGGHPPFQGDNAAELLARILFEPPLELADAAPDTPVALLDAVRRALQKDRNDRFATAAEFADALRRCPLGNTMPLAPRSASPPRESDSPCDESAAAVTGDEETLADGAIDVSGEAATETDEMSVPFAPAVGDGKVREEAREREGERGERERGASVLMRALWYLVALPVAISPALLSLAEPTWSFVALGLPADLPTPVAWGLAAALCTGFVAATIRVERFWRGVQGGNTSLLQGPLFVIFPALGLALSLFHFLTLNGRNSSYSLALRTYTQLDRVQAEELSELIAAGNSGFLKATAFDSFVVSILALIVLLGYLFASPPVPKEQRGGWRLWLLLPAALGVMALWQLFLFPEALAMMGIWVFVMYLLWLLVAVAVIRLRRRESRGMWKAAIVKGIVALAALTGVQIGLGYIQANAAFPRSNVDLSPGDLAWMFDGVINPLIWRGFLAQWALFALLFGMLAIACRTGDRAGPKQAPPSRWVASLAIVVVTALPVTLLVAAMDTASLRFTSLTVASMEPARLAPDQRSSFYIDREPQALRAGRRGLLAGLTHGEREIDSSADDLLPALAGRESCPEQLVATLRSEPPPAPARCITGIEARHYCEGLGKRLPTPAEWEAAVAGEQGQVRRSDLAEWTMHEVHGTPTFEVRGQPATEEPLRLAPNELSSRVGFRCAWSYRER